MERITRELAARTAMLERPRLVYSTQQTPQRVREQDKNKGCCPASSDIRSYNPMEEGTSGRTKFWSWKDGTVDCATVPVVHVQGERKRY